MYRLHKSNTHAEVKQNIYEKIRHKELFEMLGKVCKKTEFAKETSKYKLKTPTSSRYKNLNM